MMKSTGVYGLVVSTVMVLALAGCGSVGGAVQGGQQALDSAGQAIERAPDFPGAQELDQVLGSAQEALSQDPATTSLGVPRSTLETACALISLGG